MHLDLVWENDINTIQFNIQDIKQEYDNISIRGENNTEFVDYYIINKSQQLQISDCTLDLSQIKGNINLISISNCIYVNDFTDDLSVCTLNVYNSKIQVQQLKNVKLQYLSVSLINISEICFDFENCYLLKCYLNNLQITDVTLDLSKLSGAWNSVQFDNCMFSGQVNNTIFKVQTTNIVISEANQLNNLKSLENLVCSYFQLSLTQHEVCYKVELQMQNVYKQKKAMHAYLFNCSCDLTSIQSQWTSIKFNNCKLTGNPTLYANIFANTQIQVIMNETCTQCDLSALHGINSQLTISLTKINPNFPSIKLCNPKQLYLIYCTFDLSQLAGEWNYLNISSCTITQSFSNNYLIKAKSLIFVDSNTDYYPNLIADYLQIRSQSLNVFPNAKKLFLIDSTINVSEKNNSIKELRFKNPKFNKFSVLNLNSLISIDLNFVKQTEKAFQTRTAIIQFIRCKKVQMNQLKQKRNRIQYEQNLRDIKMERNLKMKMILNWCLSLEWSGGE
ncbi:Hypothetical_protein [Hexamita inflata]|uniref:Hypothetical_protein n=1 Tax=Hexamita inflata TaxID=28002 RepID=A0AA86N9U6_9EUKA|nr:Hypothetical protein HINF_LOCUS3432 [Hexamita inflata]